MNFEPILAITKNRDAGYKYFYRFYLLILNFNCTYVLVFYFFRNYCLHDPTSNADVTYRAKIKLSLSLSLILSLFTVV